MSLKLIKCKGDIFDTSADIICNAVNCRGAMCGGIAAAFKSKFPKMNEAYEDACNEGKGIVKIGSGHFYKLSATESNNWHIIANVPTMKLPGSEASVIDISLSLINLFEFASNHGYKTIAMPYLGCGVGGLEPEIFEKMLRTYKTEDDITVLLVEYK